MDTIERIGKLEDCRIRYHSLFAGLARFEDLYTEEQKASLEEADRIILDVFMTARAALDAQAVREQILEGAKARGMDPQAVGDHLIVVSSGRL